MNKSLLLFGICVVVPMYAQKKDIIETVQCTKNSIRIVLNSELKKQGYILEDFFVEYNDDQIDCTQLDYSIITMPAIMNLITCIWALGDTYYIDAMDEQLYSSLQIVKEVFKRLYPHTSWEGELVPRNLVDNSRHFLSPIKNSNHIVTLFSHGLDSICTSLRHRDKQQLLLTAWGHSDCPLGQVEVWKYVHDLVVSYASTFDQSVLFFSSNYHRFLGFKHIANSLSKEITSWRIEAIEGLGWIGLAAPVLISKGYKQLYLASSQCWDNPYPQAALPLIDENITFAGVRIVHDAFHMTREQKSKYVSEQCKALNIPSLTLRVCSMISRNKGRNCNNCEKCLRTITAFLLLGENLKKFGFMVSDEVAIARVKAYLPTIKMIDRASFFWRTLQQFAKRNYKSLDILHQRFAQWLINFNIDTITEFRPTYTIDWNNFRDVYKKIPERLLKKNEVSKDRLLRCCF